MSAAELFTKSCDSDNSGTLVYADVNNAATTNEVSMVIQP